MKYKNLILSSLSFFAFFYVNMCHGDTLEYLVKEKLKKDDSFSSSSETIRWTFTEDAFKTRETWTNFKDTVNCQVKVKDIQKCEVIVKGAFDDLTSSKSYMPFSLNLQLKNKVPVCQRIDGDDSKNSVQTFSFSKIDMPLDSELRGKEIGERLNCLVISKPENNKSAKASVNNDEEAAAKKQELLAKKAEEAKLKQEALAKQKEEAAAKKKEEAAQKEETKSSDDAVIEETKKAEEAKLKQEALAKQKEEAAAKKQELLAKKAEEAKLKQEALAKQKEEAAAKKQELLAKKAEEAKLKQEALAKQKEEAAAKKKEEAPQKEDSKNKFEQIYSTLGQLKTEEIDPEKIKLQKEVEDALDQNIFLKPINLSTRDFGVDQAFFDQANVKVNKYEICKNNDQACRILFFGPFYLNNKANNSAYIESIEKEIK